MHEQSMLRYVQSVCKYIVGSHDISGRSFNTPITIACSDGTNENHVLVRPGSDYQFDLVSPCTVTATDPNKDIEVLPMNLALPYRLAGLC